MRRDCCDTTLFLSLNKLTEKGEWRGKFQRRQQRAHARFPTPCDGGHGEMAAASAGGGIFARTDRRAVQGTASMERFSAFSATSSTQELHSVL